MAATAEANDWTGNELTKFNRDILVLANPEIANLPGWVIGLVAAGGLAAASIFPALMMGMFSTRVKNKGAVAGMLAGLLVTLLYIFLHKGWFFIPGTNSFTDAEPLLGTIKSTSFGAIGAAINFAVAFFVSSRTEELPEDVRELVESVRVPRGAGAAQAGH